MQMLVVFFIVFDYFYECSFGIIIMIGLVEIGSCAGFGQTSCDCYLHKL